MVARKTRKTKEEELFDEGETTDRIEAPAPSVRIAPSRVVHVEPSEIVAALNGAVGGINAVFQLRDHLAGEIALLKEELGLAREMRVEQAKIEALKREQDNFEYEFGIRRKRSEEELARSEEEKGAELKRSEEEHAAKLKAQAAEQVSRLKVERDDHDRRLKIERDDFEREQSLFAQEQKAFEERAKALDAERKAMRERLVAELNRENEHQTKVAVLNHQKEVELLRGELRLEQANRGKFETLLTDVRAQNDKLAEQLSTLSREALASASSSSMAVKLGDIISQMSPGTGPVRGM